MHAVHFFVKYVHETDSQKLGDGLQQEPIKVICSCLQSRKGTSIRNAKWCLWEWCAFPSLICAWNAQPRSQDLSLGLRAVAGCGRRAKSESLGTRLHKAKLPHWDHQSRSQRPRSFLSATGIGTSSRFFERMIKGSPGNEIAGPPTLSHQTKSNSVGLSVVHNFCERQTS